MIVDSGKEALASTMASTFTKVRIGNGGDDTASSQTALDAFVAEKTVTPSRIGSQLVWTASFTGAEIGTQGVSEIGIFNTADTLLSRVTFTNTGVVPSADTVTFTIRLEVD
jgi:PPE-repeat protein|tara:strand:- start:2979 stop:3311 length:333 start_codon:yes stop_codon:yes gene_type:complete